MSARPVMRKPRGTGLANAVMVGPAVALFTALLVIPAGLAVGLSFTDWNGYTANPNVVGGANYRELVTDPSLRQAAVVTLLAAAVGTVAMNALGLGFAVLVGKASRLNSVLRMILFYPHVLSALIVGFLWSAILGTTGAVNSFLTSHGQDVLPFLSDPVWARATLVAVLVWAGFGVNVVLYVAGLQTVPRQLVEAARTDGASRRQVFRHVTLPAIAPVVTVNVVLSLIVLLKTYDVVVSLTGGGPAGQTQTLAYLILWNSFHDGRLGFGSAQSVVLMIVTAALALTVTRLRRRAEQGASA